MSGSDRRLAQTVAQLDLANARLDRVIDNFIRLRNTLMQIESLVRNPYGYDGDVLQLASAGLRATDALATQILEGVSDEMV